jgi:hypothetical protein
VRQKNDNDEVEVYRYVTENTFDAYMFQLVENKQKFIGQIMTSKSPVRSATDVDETALSYAEIKALATGNPLIKEKMDLDVDVARLKMLKASHQSQRFTLEDMIATTYPNKIKATEERIAGFTVDIALAQKTSGMDKDTFRMRVKDYDFTDKQKAGTAILAITQQMTSAESMPLGEYRGFAMEVSFDIFHREYNVWLKGTLSHKAVLGDDPLGCITRINNALDSMPERLAATQSELENTKLQLENAKAEVDKPFAQEDELTTKSARLKELEHELDMDKSDGETLDDGLDEPEEPKRKVERER